MSAVSGAGRRWRRQAGLTLIEIMVAMIILSIGILGVFGLHIVAKRGNLDALHYTQASTLANDMIDRMRLNPQVLESYAGSQFALYDGDFPAVNCNQSNAHCTAEQMAIWDRFSWDNMLAGQPTLMGFDGIGAPPSALGCIFINDRNVELVVSWQGSNPTQDGAQNNSNQAQSCGQANEFRRQLVIQTVVATAL